MSERPLALVTGASSGLGACFARQLAAAGHDLVIAARRSQRLDQLATSLRADHGAQVNCVTVDLSTAEGPAHLAEAALALARPVQVLVNNAGVGALGAFEDLPLARQLAMLDLNIRALTELTHLFVAHMRAHGHKSHILNVASVASYQPLPLMAVYAASKSYVRDFSVALSRELASTNIRVTCVHPGSTTTEFTEVAGMKVSPLANRAFMDADDVARQGLRAMGRGRAQVVTGWLNRVIVFLASISPRSLTSRMGHKVMKSL